MTDRVIRAATPDDGKAMLSLIEAQPSSGNLRILYTRRPDAYTSYLTENQNAELTVYTNSDGQLLAQGACLPQKLYINGEPKLMGYITGLHKREGAFFNLFAMAAEGFKRSQCSLFFCSVLSENESVLQMLLKKKYKAFSLAPLCDYQTYLLHPSALKAIKTEISGYALRKADPSDEPALTAFLQKEGKQYSLFPHVESLNSYSGLSIENFYILYKDSEILACGALWDQRAYKQYIAFAYRGIYSLIEKTGPLPRLFRLPPLPKIGTTAKFAQLAFLLAKNDHSPYLRAFLRLLSMEIPKTFDFIAIGTTLGSSVDQICNPLRSISFGSKICLVNAGETTPDSPIANPRPECAFL